MVCTFYAITQHISLKNETVRPTDTAALIKLKKLSGGENTCAQSVLLVKT